MLVNWCAFILILVKQEILQHAENSCSTDIPLKATFGLAPSVDSDRLISV